MMQKSLNIVLLAVLAALVAATWGLRREYTERNDEFLPGMVNTRRYNAQSPSPVFPDGKTLQAPAPGAIARAYPPLRYGTTPEEAARAGEELANPETSTAGSGAVVFSTFCQPCHGSGALGDGPVARRGFPPPPSLLADKARKLKDGQMFHIITFGQGNMPSLASQVSRQDRWRAVAYVRSLQQTPGN